jgi:S-(hydroxymethyl)glutathione dehydrogenase/alcohol dehydrogenase
MNLDNKKYLQPKFFYGAVLEKKKKLKIFKLEFPKLKRGQVLVKIIYTSICRSQIMEINGLRGKDNYLPHLLGHEGYGKIINVGPLVKNFKKNDEVILGWIKNNNKNYLGSNTRLFNSKKYINFGPISTFSTYSVVAENRLVLKPKKLKPKHAPLFGCAILTGAGMVFNQAKPERTKNVLVLGLGAVGLSVLAALKCKKIKNIVAVDNLKNRLNLAKRFGAKTVLSLKKFSSSKYFKDKFDLCFDSTGSVSSIEFGFSKLKNSGKLFFASHPENNSKIKIDPYELIKGKKIFGSWGGESNPKKDIPKIFKIFMKNRINLNLFLSKTYSLSDINFAVNEFQKGKVLRPLIKMDY